MFLLKSIDLVALVSLLVQAVVAWVFFAIQRTLTRREGAARAVVEFQWAFFALASALTARGATVLLGDPGRGNLDGAPLRLLAQYPVLVNDPSLPRCERETSVFAVVG